jgi:hypothetical protein
MLKEAKLLDEDARLLFKYLSSISFRNAKNEFDSLNYTTWVPIF